MQIVLRLLQEEVPHIFFGVLNAPLFGLIPQLVSHGLLALLVEEGWHHADGQQVVDQFKEAFFDDVCIREEEQSRSLTEHFEELLEIFSELLLLVAASELDEE